MNQMEKILINCVCKNDFAQAKKIAKDILQGIRTQTDEKFRTHNLQLLEESEVLKVPYNLQHILIAEDVRNYPEERFLLRENEKQIIEKVKKSYAAASWLEEKGMKYLPSVLLYGKTGCGKTELSKYIAYTLRLPFVYVRFSSLVESLLGKTQSNLSLIFDFVKAVPCVLCFDEIDAIGIERGDHNDVSEMSRVVISMMQEIDRLPNRVILIGTTNRFDRLDPALSRRFTISYEVMPLNHEEIKELSKKIFDAAGNELGDWYEPWLKESFGGTAAASEVLNKSIGRLVEMFQNNGGM